MADWAIERLAAHHDRSAFDCGKPPLSDWLRQQAGQYERRDLARTYVVVRPGQPRVFGDHALASCQLRHEDLPAGHPKGLPRRLGIPAALLARLAVDRSVQGQGLGDTLLVDALRRVLHLADRIGILAVAVEAIDDQARADYLHKGFEPLLDDPRHLFLPLRIIRQLGLAPLAD
jgi:GNAT superfamily N-acetyltransferase